MIASLSLALAFIGSVQTDPVPPVSRWILRSDPALCRLERQNAEPPVTLSIDTTPGSDVYRVAIASRAVKGSASFVPAALTFASSVKPMNGRASVATLPNGMPVIWMQGLAPEFLDQLASTDRVTIATINGKGGSAAVIGPAEAVRAFRGCNAEQLIDWGADAGQFAPGGTIPVAVKNRDAWLSNKELLALGRQSAKSNFDAVFRVAISADGIIDDCRAVTDDVDKKAEKIACSAVVDKPLFTAAKDPNGQFVRGVATFRVVLERRTSRH